MTVSRVFSDSTRVAEETRKRVLAAARKLKYQPNLAARALRTGRSDTIGFLLASKTGLEGDFHSASFAAFDSVISTARLSLTLCVPEREGQRVGRMAENLFTSGRCLALVVRYDHLTEEDLEELASLEAPVLLANYDPAMASQFSGLNFVGFDNRKGARLAVRHLIALGHRQIAYLGGTSGWTDSVQREEGYRAAMREAGFTVDEKWVKYCDFAYGFESGREAIAQVLGQKLQTPTAVFCASDEITAGAMAGIRQWGLSIPNDISIVGFDDTRWARFLSPPLTTVSHSGAELGTRLGQILLKLLENPKGGPYHEILETRLVIRDSTGRAPSGN